MKKKNVFIKQLRKILILKPLSFRILSLYSEMQNGALMLCEGLTLSSLNFPLSSSFTISRELLSQFSTCSGWRWLEVGRKWRKKNVFIKQFHKILILKPISFRILSYYSDMQNGALMLREGLTLSGSNLPLSSPSTTSRELLSHFSTYSGWR